MKPGIEALHEHLACSRCHVLGVPCILDDFERMSRIETRGDDQRLESQAQKQKRTPQMDEAERATLDRGQRGGHLLTLESAHQKDVNKFDDFYRRRSHITIQVELVGRQPSFGLALRGLKLNSEVSIDDLVDDDLARAMAAWTEREISLWLPFVPSLWSLRLTRRQSQPQSQSKSDVVALEILEVVQYAIAAQHMSQVETSHRRSITMAVKNQVEKHLGPLMLLTPGSYESAQALQLIAAFPVVFGDPGPIAGAAKRMTIASLSTTDVPFSNTTDVPFSNVDVDLESFVFFCSACIWDDIYAYGNTDYLVLHKSDWLFKEANITFFLDEVMGKEKWNGSRKERRERLGKVCVLLRALCMAYTAKAWSRSDLVDMNADDVTRARDLDACLEAWQADMGQFRARLDLCLGDPPGSEQISGFDDDDCRCRQRLLDWLIVESSALHLIVSAKVFRKAFKTNITPGYFRNLIEGVGVSDAIRTLTFKHGETRTDACETVLATMTRMAMIASEKQGSSGLSPDRELYPSILAAGYLLLSAMLAMDTFSFTVKFYRGMPRRADSWRLALGGAVRFAKGLTYNSIEDGGNAALSAKIVAGMLDTIAIWERALMTSHTSHGPKESATGSTGGSSSATIRSEVGEDTSAHSASSDTTLPVHKSVVDTSERAPSPGRPERNEWSSLATASGTDLGLWNTDELQAMMSDVFGQTDWGDVLPELDTGDLSLYSNSSS